jgi:integrase/recombinase XerD
METPKKIRVKKTKFDFSYEHVTGAALLETRRKKNNGLYPVTYRITYTRKQVRYKSGYDLKIKDWDGIESTKQKELLKKRDLIKAGLKRIEDEVENLVLKGDFTFDLLNRRLSRGNIDSVLTAFDNKRRSLIDTDRIGSADYYYTASQSIRKFSHEDLRFSDITPDWLRRFEKWMLENKKSYTTIGMYMRALRAIVNETKKAGTITEAQYPFGVDLYEIPEGKGRKTALTLEQVGKLISEPLLTDSEKRCRDLWFFSYLCNGINMNDLLRLKYSDIEDGEISWYRKKTLHTAKKKDRITAILLPEMDQIIDRWGNREKKPEQYIFPFLSADISPVDEKRIVKNATRLINKKMRALGMSIGIGPVTTYTARHSFATVLKRSGANIAYISESLGHTDLKTTESYLKSFEKKERLKNAAELTKF